MATKTTTTTTTSGEVENGGGGGGGGRSILDDYEILSTLGEGSFGTAYLGRTRATGEEVVVKKVKMNGMCVKERIQALEEVYILGRLSHPHLVRVFQGQVVATRRDHSLYIVSEYCQGGDLLRHLSGRKSALPEETALQYFVQMGLALKHCADRKVMHRDIKPENIFLTAAGVVKLGDFGAAIVCNSTHEFRRTYCGTILYMAPEVVSAQPYSFSSDIYSLGCVLYIMLCNKMPFSKHTPPELLKQQIRTGRYPRLSRQQHPQHPQSQQQQQQQQQQHRNGPVLSEEVVALQEAMMSTDPQRRPTINQIFEFPVVVRAVASLRAQGLADSALLLDEFSHSVLHSAYWFTSYDPVHVAIFMDKVGLTPAATDFIRNSSNSSSNSNNNSNNNNNGNNNGNAQVWGGKAVMEAANMVGTPAATVLAAGMCAADFALLKQAMVFVARTAMSEWNSFAEFASMSTTSFEKYLQRLLIGDEARRILLARGITPLGLVGLSAETLSEWLGAQSAATILFAVRCLPLQDAVACSQ